MTDQEIITLFFQRNERAIEQTQIKYGAYCQKIAGRILQDPRDCEECFSETLLRVWNSIPPKKPSNFKLYIAAITRNLAFSSFRKMTAQKRGGTEVELALNELSECLSSAETPEGAVLVQELGNVINRFLATLPLRDRNIFLRRYFFTESTKDIAVRYKLRESNIHMILSRTRGKLKRYLQEGGYTA